MFIEKDTDNTTNSDFDDYLYLMNVSNFDDVNTNDNDDDDDDHEDEDEDEVDDEYDDA